MSQQTPHAAPAASPSRDTEKLSKEIDFALDKLKKKPAPSEKRQIEEGIRGAKRGAKISLDKNSRDQDFELQKQLEDKKNNVFEIAKDMATSPYGQSPSFEDLVSQQLEGQTGITPTGSIQALIDKIVLTLSYIRSKDLQNCKVMLKNPPGFENAILDVKIQGDKCFVSFLNLSEEAFKLLESQQADLKEHFQNKVASFQLEKVHIEKQSESLLASHHEGSMQHNQDEEERKDRRQKKKKEEQLSS